MKTYRQIRSMIDQIEDGLVCPSAERMCLIMALEWVLDGEVSTSLPLEDWLNEEASNVGQH